MTEAVLQLLHKIDKEGLFFRLRGSELWAQPEALPLLVQLTVAERFELRAFLQQQLGDKSEDAAGLAERWPAQQPMRGSAWPFVRLNLHSKRLASRRQIAKARRDSDAACRKRALETATGCQPRVRPAAAARLPLRRQQELSLQSKPWRRFFNCDTSANYR
jgi:hypothetical protein